MSPLLYVTKDINVDNKQSESLFDLHFYLFSRKCLSVTPVITLFLFVVAETVELLVVSVTSTMDIAIIVGDIITVKTIHEDMNGIRIRRRSFEYIHINDVCSILHFVMNLNQ